MPATTFEKKALILGQLWINFKAEDEWVDFFVYNDLGLPLAFAFAEGIINQTPTLEQYINETWDLFIEGLGVQDTGFEHIEELVDNDWPSVPERARDIVLSICQTFKPYYEETLRTSKPFPLQNITIQTFISPMVV